MVDFIASTLRLSVPLALAAAGALFALRARVFHLGIEGLLVISAFTSVAIARTSGSTVVAIVGAAVVSVALSVVYWFLIDRLQADTVIAGLGLGTIAVGVSAYVLQWGFGERGSLDTDVRLPRPVSGQVDGLLGVVNELSLLGWLTPLLLVVGWFVLRRTRLGLQITAVGDYEFGARAAAIDPSLVRLKGLVVCGLFASLAGVELALGGLSTFSEGISNGRGFIALAACLFGRLSPLGTAVASVLFGAAAATGIRAQVIGFDAVPRPFVLMVPYVLTIIALVIGTRVQNRIDRVGGLRS